jgi:hypothetical protein
MANNYSYFSETIGDLTPAEMEWIETVLFIEPFEGGDVKCKEAVSALIDKLGVEELEFESWPGFEWEIDGSLSMQDNNLYFDTDPLFIFIQSFIRKFRPDMIFSMTWADVCDQPRIGEFGGGWAVITKDAVHCDNTWSAAKACVSDIERERKDPAVLDEFHKIKPHLSHMDCLEIANYAGSESITVECTKCGVVVHELYNRDQDMENKNGNPT